MTRRYLAVLALVIGAAIVAGPPLDAQKGKPPSDVPGSFTMRTTPPYDPDASNADRVTGDENGPYTAGAAGTYVNLNGNREFRAGLYGLRYVQLDLFDSIAGTVCTTNCFNTFLLDRIVIPQPNTYPPEGPIAW